VTEADSSLSPARSCGTSGLGTRPCEASDGPSRPVR